MTQLAQDSAEVRYIDEALSQWRQGDAALQERWFIHAADPSRALTPESGEAEGGLQAITAEVEGLVVVTQTCDIVRSCSKRPFIEVVPLVQVETAMLQDVRRGRRPAYALVPALAGQGLVADLDRVMTVEKSLVSSWQRTPGCTTDAEAREFAQALARKRSRFAFPDDFTHLVRRLLERLQDKHDKLSQEGRALRALREIRVQATPSWDHEQVELTFWFICDEAGDSFEGKRWNEYVEGWLKLVPASDRFKQVHGVIVALEDLSASDYVGSERLDLDHLSARQPPSV